MNVPGAPTIPDDYLVTPRNPLATTATRDLQRLALRLMTMPIVAQAAEGAIRKWRSIVGRDASVQAWSLFDAAMREYVFHHVLKAANADPNYPQIVRTQTMPHEWFGMKVPGSRMAGDNPDTIYHFAPIDGTSRYEIIGQRFAPAAADLSFTVSGNSGFTRPLALKEASAMNIGTEGGFVITVGPDTEAARQNHITTRRGAKFLFIRDTQCDWREIPHALYIRRIDPPTAAPRTLDQIAEDAAGLLADDVAETFWGMRIPLGFEPNVVGVPFGTAAIGGMSSQMISYSHFQLADDEAIVATFSEVGSAYRGAVLFNFWLNSIDYVDRLSSLNRAQSVANADGSVTLVISARDPGVHNWLDTAGQDRVFLCHRWQGLPDGAASLVKSSGRLVKWGELSAALPANMKRVSEAQREQQLAERRDSYALRFVVDGDH